MRTYGWMWMVLLYPVIAETAVTPLTLEQAIESGLDEAPQVLAQAVSLEAARSLAVSAGRLPDPELVLGIDNLPVTGPDAYSTTRDFMTMRKVGVMQEFPRREKRRLQRERAAAETELAEAQLVQTRLAIAREITEAWIRRASSEAALEHLQELQPEIELQAAAARAAVASGRASSADALAAEGAVAELANRILKLQSAARRAQLELARWIGEEAARPLAPMPRFDEVPATETAFLESIPHHAALLPFEARTTAARLEVALAQAERRPDWSAELAFAKRGPEFSDMASLQFRIELPLFARNRQAPVIAARRAELRRIDADRDAELRMHAAEVRQMFVEWRAVGEQLSRYERDLLPLARERSQAALAAYRAGRGSLLPALGSFEREIELRVEYAALQDEHGRAWAFLRYLTPAQVSES